MGRKVPLWQCLIVMLAMIGLLMWSILMDNGGEPHIALILAAAVATVVAKINGWKWASWHPSTDPCRRSSSWASWDV